MERYRTSVGIVLIVVAYLTFAAFNSQVLSGNKLDLTEHGLYTLSAGSREVVETIDEPLHLYFFFSEAASADLPGLRAYAERVWQLLQQFESVAGGRILLHRIDPLPFTDAEDRAAAFGLQAVPVGANGELFFGLAATNALDGEEVIPFFQPDRETFVEYEVSRLIDTLANPDRPVVGLLSSIDIAPGFDTQTFQPTPGWIIADELGSRFDLRTIDPVEFALDDDIDVLIVIHPKDLSEEVLFSIDQFAMAGGRVLTFMDPLAEIDSASDPGVLPSSVAGFSRLIESWGASLVRDKVVADADLALQVSGGDGRPARHLSILGAGSAQLSADDIVTGALESVNLASAGMLSPRDGATTEFSALITSSVRAAPADAYRVQAMRGPGELQQDFAPTGERYVMAARLSGRAQSAFADGDTRTADRSEPLAETDNLNVIVVADVDLLADRLWVQVQNFFGQRIATPFADNGDFVVNAVDNLLGSSSLISVRSRGRFSRPFDVVADLRREAESRYLESADRLQAELAETERKLAELEAGRADAGVLSLSSEQEREIDRFQDEKLNIRRQLRDVRFQLDREINSLGMTLKLVNIILMPLILTLMLYLVARFWRAEPPSRRAPGVE